MKKMMMSGAMLLSMTAFVINFCACGTKEHEKEACHVHPAVAPAAEQVAPEAEATRAPEAEAETRASSGSVIELKSEAEFNSLIAQGNVLVDFYAPWCGPCKALAPVLHDLAKENKHITFVKVNTESHSALSSKYGIRSLPTLIFFKNGQKVDTIKGSQSKGNLQAKLDSLFTR